MKYIVVGLIVFIVYVSFAGSTSPYTLATATIISGVLSALTAKYLVVDERKLMEPWRLLVLIYYFFKYMTIIEFKAHMDVVKRTFTMDIKPGIVKVPVNAKSRYARSLIMGSITNTPGTVVVDEKDDYFYVNWIYVSSPDPLEAKKAISEEFENFAIKIFD
jgi:multicomponent Na+:H+ antiporter subunit E